MESERYLRGWEVLRALDPVQSEKVLANLREIAPDFAKERA